MNKGFKNGFNAYTLKLIAIIAMTLQHSAIVFKQVVPFEAKISLYAFSGLTFPIMAFLLVEGYKHTSNFKRYALRLLFFAIITEIPHMWAMKGFGLNVMFTLLLGLVTLYLHDHMKNRTAFWLAFIGLSLATIIMDWSLMGVPMILLYYLLRGKWKKILIPVLLPIGYAFVQFIVKCIVPSMSGIEDLPSLAFAFIGCGLSIPLLTYYNGQRGRSSKYLFYLFYPGHMIVLALLRGLLLNDWSMF